MYDVTTIGDLPGGASGHLALPWPEIPPGWVPSGVPGVTPGPPRPLQSKESVSAPAVAVIAIAGVLFGALGLWAWGKYG